MSGWPYLLLLPSAVALAREDFRTRRVSVVWLVLLGMGALAVRWIESGFGPMLVCVTGNLLLLGLVAGTIATYVYMRGRLLRRFFRHGFGGGDAAMLCALTPLFGPEGYVRFLLAASIAALVGWCVSRRRTIPLAGYLAATLIGYVCYKIGVSWS